MTSVERGEHNLGEISEPKPWHGLAVAPRLELALQGAIALTIAVVLFRVDPAQADWLPSCPLHSLTGLFCPGCGSTRAIHQLLHGRWGQAFGLNPLLVLSLPLLAWALIGESGRRFGGRSAQWMRIPPRLLWIFFATVIVFWVTRNLPGPAFELLAP